MFPALKPVLYQTKPGLPAIALYSTNNFPTLNSIKQ